jgi:hypothetical protein
MIVRLYQILLLVATFVSAAIGATADSISQDTTNSMAVKILDLHDVLQGHYCYVPIVKLHGPELLSGFDLLISYDSNVLTFTSAELGSALNSSGCGWMNLAAQVDWSGDCTPEGSVKSLRLVASIDPLETTQESLSSVLPDTCEIVRIKFLTTNDRTYDCASTPIRFYWQDCRDNSFCTVFGDTALISRRIFDTPDYEQYTYRPRISEITGIDCQSRVQSGGACLGCDSIAQSNRPARIVDFFNGSINLACSGPIDVRGDINLNGIANEIADARMLADAILRGLDALPRLGRDGSIWGSDINVDNRPMTVADLVYLQRIIIGDALPYSRQKPLFDTATVKFSQELFSINSPAEIGAVLVVFDCDSNFHVRPLTDFITTDYYDSTAGELRILVTCDVSYNDSGSGNGCREKHLPAGENKLFSIHGRAKLKEVQISDYNGNLLSTNYDPDPWPTLSRQFSSAGITDSAGNPLYPPSGIEKLSTFIMSTEEVDWPHRADSKIRLNFRDTTDWRVDVFDDRHQLALTYQGRDIGRKTINVDATSLCPGMYVCTLTAGSVTATGPLIRWSSGYNQ